MNDKFLIEFNMVDGCRGVGAGWHILEFLGVEKKGLIFRDWHGDKVCIPHKLFRFKKVYKKETKVELDGRVLVKEKGKWVNLGKLFKVKVKQRKSSKRDLGDLL